MMFIRRNLFSLFIILFLSSILFLIGCGKDEGDGGAKPDTTPPSAPVLVSVISDSNGVKITWQANTESDVTGYFICYSTTSTVDKTKLVSSTPEPHPHSSYTKVISQVGGTALTAGTTYYFAIYAVDNSGNASNLSNVKGMVAKMWTKFEAKNYTGAITDFTTAVSLYPDYADAYNGLGWAYSKTSNLTNAKTNFTTALAKAGSDNALKIDIYAGRAFVYLADNDYTNAMTDANAVLSANSTYKFSHLPSIDWRDLTILLAQCYYHTGSYADVVTQIKKIDSTFDMSEPFTETKLNELMLKIEDLQRLWG